MTDDAFTELAAAGAKHSWVHQAPRFGQDEKGEITVFDRAQGCTLTDTKGREIFDGISGAWVVNIGHGRAEVADAMAEQARRIAYASAFDFLAEPSIRLAERLANLCPEPLERVFISNSGTDAVEAAMAIARQYHFNNGERGRYKFVSRRGSYHGSTFGGKSLSGFRHALLQQRFAPMLEGCIQVPGPNTYRPEDGLDPKSYIIRCAKEIERAILHEGPDSVAAVIAEPISASAGVHVPDVEYWQIIRDVCSRYGVLLILDEVLVGMGRTGKMFAFEHFGIVPDLLTLSKGVASGYAPIGATVVSRDVADTFDGQNALAHGYTYGNHPVSSRAALTNIEILQSESLIAKAAQTGAYMIERLGELANMHPSIGHVRGIGMLASVELVSDRAMKTPFAVETNMSAKLTRYLMEEGVFLRVWDVIHVAPPLIATQSEIDHLTECMSRAIGRFESEVGIG